MESPNKARINRARRTAARYGLTIRKSRTRDPLAPTYGCWELIDSEDHTTATVFSIEEVEENLARLGREAQERFRSRA